MDYSPPIENETPSFAVAVFDFDGTLTINDSFWLFLIAAAGMPRLVLALAEVLTQMTLRYAKNRDDPEIRDYRTFIKAHLLHRLLTEKSVSQLGPAIAKLQHWIRWNEAVRQNLLNHHAKGHHIIIASGALDLYLADLMKNLPYDALICTQIGVKDGVITGEMPNGNCVRERKAELVQDYLAAHGPFTESWGYGNFPHDVPMLNLLKHRIII